MLVRSQDNEKITDRIEFLIAGIPEKGWGVYQSERLFGEYSSLEKAIKALDMLEDRYEMPITYVNVSSVETDRHEFFVFQFPTEEEIEDEK